MLISKIIIAFVIAVIIFLATGAVIDNFCGTTWSGDTAYCSLEGRPTFAFQPDLIKIDADLLLGISFVPAILVFIATLSFMNKKPSDVDKEESV